MITAGIDPGRKGGIVKLKGGALESAWPMPIKRGQINWDGLRIILAVLAQEPVSVAIEKQMPFTGRDKKGKPHVMFGTGPMLENYGRLKLLLDQSGLAYVEIMPATWQAAYRAHTRKLGVGVLEPGLSDAERVVARNRSNKAASVRLAEILWPQESSWLRERGRWTEGVAEAALFAEYHRSRLIMEQTHGQAQTGNGGATTRSAGKAGRGPK